MTVLYDAAGIRIGQTEPGSGNRTKVHFGTEFQWTQATNLQEARIEVRGMGGDIGYKYMGVATLRTETGDALGIEPRVIGHWVVVFVLSGVVANGVLRGVGARQRKRRLAYSALATMAVVICFPGMAGACSAPQPPCASERHRIPRRPSNG